MWLHLRTGFLTVVENQNNKDTVLVRARVKKDLEEFRKRYVRPSDGKVLKIVFHPTFDYPFRMVTPKTVFAEAMQLASLDIDYEKFKQVVLKEQGSARFAFMNRLWSILIGLEEDPNRINKYFSRHLKLDGSKK